MWTRSVIQGKWKLITYQDPLPKERPNAGGHNRKYPDQNQELFDLLADPHETKDLSKEHGSGFRAAGQDERLVGSEQSGE